MILVTGGTGLVGSHLLYHLLLENDSVKAIHRKSSDLNTIKKVFSYYTSDFENFFQRIKWVEAGLEDITSLESAFDTVTQVYHCAALVSFDPKDYQKMRNINIDGTSNIVNMCISNAVEKLCFVSSIAAIEKNEGPLIDESGEWNNSKLKSGYAISKYGAEMEVWRASQEGVDVVIVNPGIILGSGFWNKGSGKIFSRIYNGFNFYTDRVTGFVSVKDVVRVMVKLMASNIKNERFILVGGNVSFKDVFNQIADNFNKKRPKIKLTRFMCELLWRLNYILSIFTRTGTYIEKRTAKTINSKLYYSSKKIEEALPFKFEKVEESIQTICGDFLIEN